MRWGTAREREPGKGKELQGREEGLDGSGRLRGVFRGVGAAATAKQEVAGALRRAPGLASAYWQRKKRTRGGGGGLGQREELGRLQVSGPGGLQVMFPSLSLFFLFYLCFLFF